MQETRIYLILTVIFGDLTWQIATSNSTGQIHYELSPLDWGVNK